jgi:hypothetical protein
VSLTVGIVSAATVTQSINYQGKLTDAAGNPLTGDYSVTFKLYNVSSVGTALATDTHTVQASKGLFTTQITADSSFFDGRALWLGIKVGADAEMTPRQELRPVPYALSLRPGSIIKGISGINSVLSVIKDDDSGSAVDVATNGKTSYAIVGRTEGDYSKGIKVSTLGNYSEGVSILTYGSDSPGVYASTFKSIGIRAETIGANSDGVYATATGIGSYGVNAVSAQSYGLYADTARSDQKYGIYTPDYLYAKGTQVPAADVAEYMPVTQDVTPGTVLVIGEEGKLQPSTTAYDTRVAGIVSTSPGVTLGTKEDGNPGEQMIAVAGRVPCKVDATSAPIHAGDLLTTSDNPGYAMKAEPIEINGRTFYPSGIALGKAMGSLETGTGTIEVLVTLQ